MIKLARRPAVTVTLVAFSLLWGMWMPVIADESDQEYRLKAAFLYNFARFVSWPEATLHDPAQQIVVCVSDSALFPAGLKDIKSKKIAEHPILVKQVKLSDPRELESECHLLFVDRITESLLQPTFSDLKYVLTVGESGSFHSRGGIIQFFVQADKLRFSVNLKNARRAGVDINSRLLRLAKVVGD